MITMVSRDGTCCMGDLVATCISPQSRNRYVGEKLRGGKKIQEVLADICQVAEGVKTVHAANELADRYHLAMPITRAMYAVITDMLTAAEAYTGLMRSPAGGLSSRW